MIPRNMRDSDPIAIESHNRMNVPLLSLLTNSTGSMFLVHYGRFFRSSFSTVCFQIYRDSSKGKGSLRSADKAGVLFACVKHLKNMFGDKV